MSRSERTYYMPIRLQNGYRRRSNLIERIKDLASAPRASALGEYIKPKNTILSALSFVLALGLFFFVTVQHPNRWNTLKNRQNLIRLINFETNCAPGRIKIISTLNDLQIVKVNVCG